MFHVSTLLPHSAVNRQQLERKRHIGNDVVVIVFQDGPNGGFNPKTISSKFNRILIRLTIFLYISCFLIHGHIYCDLWYATEVITMRVLNSCQIHNQLFFLNSVLLQQMSTQSFNSSRTVVISRDTNLRCARKRVSCHTVQFCLQTRSGNRMTSSGISCWRSVSVL